MRKKDGQYEVHTADGTFTYQLTLKPVKNMNLRIKSDGSIHISAPLHVSGKTVEEMIQTNSGRIAEIRERFQKESRPVPVHRYESGERFTFLGQEYILEVSEAKQNKLELSGNTLLLKVTDMDNEALREKIFVRWQKTYTEEIFAEVCENVYGIFKNRISGYPVIKIRSMKSRWGSCHTTKGIITLSSNMIHCPIASIEYVVVHEFAHLLVPNHSKAFHEIVEQILPDWKLRKKGLGGNR